MPFPARGPTLEVQFVAFAFTTEGAHSLKEPEYYTTARACETIDICKVDFTTLFPLRFQTSAVYFNVKVRNIKLSILLLTLPPDCKRMNMNCKK